MNYLDVTNVYQNPMKTGIPRVVLNLATQLSSISADNKLLVFNGTRYFEISLDELLTPNNQKSSISKKILHKIIEWLRQGFSKLSEGTIKDCFRRSLASTIIKFLIRNPIKANSRPGSEIVLLSTDNFLILDIVTDAKRIDFLLELKKRSSFTLVTLVHDMIPHYNPQYCVPSFVAEYSQYLKVIMESNLILSISQTALQDVKNYLLTKNKEARMEVITLPITVFSTCSHQEIAETINTNKPFFMYVSTFAPHKNHKRLLEAYQAICESHEKILVPNLVLIAGSSWWKSSLEKAFDDLESAGISFQVLEKIEDCCLGALYGNARFTTYLSEIEGFGLPILESLSFATPVLSSSIGSMLEVSQGGGAISIDPFNKGTIINSLEKFMFDDDLIIKLESECKLRNFKSWEQFASEVLVAITREGAEGTFQN